MARAVLEITAYHWLIFGLASHSGRMGKLAFIPAAADASLEISADLLAILLVFNARVFSFH
jgi:hypothetical protein